jgi:hypothetical protein
MNDTLASIVVGLASLVSFICFILVLVQMFQRGAKGIAIACIVLSFCCGVGGLIAFVYGWVKAGAWNISTLMTVWTVAVAIDVVAGSLNPAPFLYFQQTVHFPTQPMR